MNLSDIENDYLEAFQSQSDALKNAYEKTISSKLTLCSNELTQCLIQRMITYYKTQDDIKQFLNKRYVSPAADYFVESVIYFLKLALKLSNSELDAHSERQISRTKNSIRPDISIWHANKVVAIIECKTQLGWNRSNWEDDFKRRELKLKESFPDAKAFLLVMTGSNWGGFSKEHILSKKYYCLLNDVSLNTTDVSLILNNILTPIEGLFEEVLKVTGAPENTPITP